MWIDNRSIEEIKESAIKHLDEMESRPTKSKEQATKELNSFLAAHRGSKDWNDYKTAKQIMGWTFDYKEHEQLTDIVLTELGL